MYTVYVYVLDTLADWEIGHVTAELHSRRFFKKDAPQVAVKTVGISKEPVKTMGGLTVTPDCTLDDMEIGESSVCCYRVRTPGMIQSSLQPLRKREPFFLPEVRYAASAGQPSHWRLRGCWIIVPTPATAWDFWICSARAIGGRASMWTHHRWQTEI